MDTKIKIEAVLAASLEKVWDFYTNPQHIIHWNFASDDWQCPNASNDLRVGGRYSARMEAKDGSFGFDFGFVYDDIRPKQKISYTMDDGRKAEVTFEDLANDQVLVRVVFDPENENSPELQQQGWQAILNNFKKYVEGNPE